MSANSWTTHRRVHTSTRSVPVRPVCAVVVGTSNYPLSSRAAHDTCGLERGIVALHFNSIVALNIVRGAGRAQVSWGRTNMRFPFRLARRHLLIPVAVTCLLAAAL